MTELFAKSEAASLLRRSKHQLERFRFAATIADPQQHDCSIVWCNEQFCELTGYRPEEVIGRNCRFLQGGADIDTRRIADAISAAQNMDFKITNYTKDGRAFYNFVSMKFLFFNGRKLICASQGIAVTPHESWQNDILEVIDNKSSAQILSSIQLAEETRLSVLKSWSIVMQSLLQDLGPGSSTR